MVKLEITVDNPILNDLITLSKKLGGNCGLPATEKAMQMGAKNIADTWRAYASKNTSIEGVPDMKRASNEYMKGVKVKKEGAFSYTISNESSIASFLEYGTNSYDMKKTHPFGKKSRVGKNGIPYLIVPFSWGTVGTVTSFSNTMTESIEDIAKRLQKSIVTNERKIEENFAGEDIERNTYEWADRIGANVDDSNAFGMVRMKDVASRGSTYFTFRIISANSPKHSWINKGIPARHVSEGLRKKCSDYIEQNIRQAMELDIT